MDDLNRGERPVKAMILPSVEQWEALEHGWLWLRAERVREVWRTHYWAEHNPASPFHGDWDRIPDDRKRERLVSPTIPVERGYPPGFDFRGPDGRNTVFVPTEADS